VSVDRRVVVGAAIVRHGRLLAACRTTPPSAAGRWEFPGGKVEPEESDAQALVREVAEELGVRIQVDRWLGGEAPIEDRYVLRVAVASLPAGEPEPRSSEHDRLRWLSADDLDAVAWLEPDLPFLDELRRLLRPLPRIEP
jgi:8-oxo-dGTP diphosphatase